jgi:signal transduction histidine kinase
MRFDDRIATVLARPADHRDRVTAQWRQLVDLLAQHREGDEGAESHRAYAFLEGRRAEIDPATRRQVAAALAGRAVAPDLVAFFASDTPSVAAPLIGSARLDEVQWLALLPRLGPSARALLRHRRDLSPSVVRALAAFGPSDFVIERAAAPAAPAAVANHATPADGESQIRELVERIEAYRRHREEEGPRTPARPVTPDGPLETFRWETGSDGTLRWVDGPSRGALIGQTIAATAVPGHFGVDGQAAGAFEKRAPFRDARFRVAGEGAAAGDWRISGVPFFDPQGGSFQGYRGTARRPRVDETARAVGAGVFGTELPADSLRQLIHELRTPLNAIIGFSEMIEGQYLGPAASGYRARAGDMIGQARRLLSAVDDLDTAARIESRRLDLDDSAVDAVALLCRLHESYEHVAAGRGARLALDIALDLPLARVEPAAAERMMARLLAATVGLAQEGEAIAATMVAARAGERPMLRLALDRPRAIAGADEAVLLDPGYGPDGDWPAAPVLGLGFALRLVRNLAEAVGGTLLIGETRITLDLPALAEAETPAGQSGNGG